MNAPKRPASPLADLHHDLEQCRVRGVAVFAAVGSRLETTQASCAALAGNLGDLATCCAEDLSTSDPVAGLASAVRTLRAAVDAVHAEAGQAGTTTTIRQGQTALDILRMEATKIAAIAAITAINAHSSGGLDLGDYVQSLRKMAIALQEGATAVEARLVRIRNAQAETRAATDRALEALDQARSAIAMAEAGQKTAGATSQQDRRKMEAMAMRVAATAQGEVQGLVTAIQFSDAFSQRIEHVATLLSRTDDPRRPVLDQIAAAQLRALADDSGETASTTRRAIDRIAALGDEVLAEFGGAGNAAETAAVLSARQAALNRALQTHSQVEPAIVAARRARHAVQSDVEGAVSRFTALSETTRAMTVLAINAGLMTSRGGTARAALSVLATAVQDSAGICEAQIRLCNVALDALGTVQSGSSGDGLDEAGASFAARVKDCQLQLQSTRERIERIASLREDAASAGDRLLATVEATKRELDGLPEVARAAGTIAGVLVPPSAAGRVSNANWSDYEDIAAIYTMTRERDVHGRLFGRPLPPPASGVSTLDDILF